MVIKDIDWYYSSIFLQLFFGGTIFYLVVLQNSYQNAQDNYICNYMSMTPLNYLQDKLWTSVTLM